MFGNISKVGEPERQRLNIDQLR